MRIRVLLDLTHVYNEEGGVEEIGAPGPDTNRTISPFS